jgi:hypothetical protein
MLNTSIQQQVAIQSKVIQQIRMRSNTQNKAIQSKAIQSKAVTIQNIQGARIIELITDAIKHTAQIKAVIIQNIQDTRVIELMTDATINPAIISPATINPAIISPKKIAVQHPATINPKKIAVQQIRMRPQIQAMMTIITVIARTIRTADGAIKMR